MNKTSFETERKFLIEYPDIQKLGSFDGYKKLNIEQTYLKGDGKKTLRVRKTECCGKLTYKFNSKTRINSLTCIEEEKDICKEEYEELLKLKNASKNTIIKERHVLPYENHFLEIDIYPFWNDRAILEIELESEKDPFCVPDFIKIIKEVTCDKRYKNAFLAENIPNDIIK